MLFFVKQAPALSILSQPRHRRVQNQASEQVLAQKQVFFVILQASKHPKASRIRTKPFLIFGKANERSQKQKRETDLIIKRYSKHTFFSRTPACERSRKKKTAQRKAVLEVTSQERARRRITGTRRPDETTASRCKLAYVGNDDVSTWSNQNSNTHG